MYLKYKIKTVLLYVCGFIAVGACVALIAWFVSILRLRTEYRAFCLEVNDVILATPAKERSIQQGDKELPLSMEALDYYNMLLLDSNVVVISREDAEPTDSSIRIILGDKSLIFTNVEKDGSLIALRWETPEGTRSYFVRSGQVSFMSMSAYFKNLARRAETQN
jgi:hypothetical protein